MERLFFVILALALVFVLVSKLIKEETIRLIFQVVLGAALVFVVLRFAGVFAC